jgi:predicted flavoprotein YhiN
VKIAGMAPAELARLIKDVPVRLTGTAPIARAISSAGGIKFAEVTENFMLRRKPGVFVAGEMLDWEAPTGGYLLQACFATGAAAGRGVLDWLAQREPA